MRVEDAYKEAASFKIGNISFDDFDLRMLVIDESNLNEHISKQPAAIAWFGSVYKTAVRLYEGKKKAFDLRQKEMYNDTKNTCAPKTPVKEIEAKSVTQYKNEIEKWEEELSELRIKADSSEILYEAFKQKSFCLNQFVHVYLAERGATDSIPGASEDKSDNVVKAALAHMRNKNA